MTVIVCCAWRCCRSIWGVNVRVRITDCPRAGSPLLFHAPYHGARSCRAAALDHSRLDLTGALIRCVGAVMAGECCREVDYLMPWCIPPHCRVYERCSIHREDCLTEHRSSDRLLRNCHLRSPFRAPSQRRKLRTRSRLLPSSR